MILIISVCKEKLHEEEFVKPIAKLLNEFKVVHYTRLENVNDYDKVIICGTALKDNCYLEDLDKFSWLKDFEGEVLGICAGMQIIGKIFGKSLIENKKIGFIDGKYYLHSFKIEGYEDSLEIGKIKGVLYHPEVRNEEIVREFCC